MRKLAFLLLILPFLSFSQSMTNATLHELYTSVSDSINGKPGRWEFFVNQIPMLSVTDENHNRMRIISPITDANNLNDELIKAALVANFHTALDVKYAVSDGILWSVFIHPLKELTKEQVEDAVRQVYSANVNFGTTFNSTSLTFPGSISNKESREVVPEKTTIKFKKS
ncbi:hypothetical protein [Neotamlana laminarinivorans]|uniref:Uncharacterized protein n=1 Tax=Neotamlana laminarinivorans TaxID=2883124 RepID=A0A9X1HY59_9FLAO|nr:hypothetical protein [Tamlana laminarinivorans]MCB4798289.1 hypothetical protein [Tamlana laminarinivorans]